MTIVVIQLGKMAVIPNRRGIALKLDIGTMISGVSCQE